MTAFVQPAKNVPTFDGTRVFHIMAVVQKEQTNKRSGF
jgi:hypothetical protein